MRKKKPPRPAKPRDPFWRLRRLLGARREPGRKDYRRAEQRRIEREAKDERE